MWLISLLPYNPYPEMPPENPEETEPTLPDGQPVDINPQLSPNVERIITVVAMLLVVALIVLLFRFFMKRRKAALAAREGGSEERSRVDANAPKRAFSDRTALSAVRRAYQKYLKLCEKEGMDRAYGDTSADVARRSTRYYLRENVDELREIYVAARYDGAGGRLEARRAKQLVRHLKEPVPERTPQGDLSEADEEED